MRPLLLLSIVAFVPAARAQTDVVDEASVIRAIENDPRTDRIAAEIDAAAATVRAAAIRAEPRLAGDREEVFPSGGGVATNYLRLVIPIDLSGRRGRAVDAARAGVDAARAQGDVERFGLVVDALRVFRGAQYHRLRVALMTAERAALVRVVDIVAERAKAGDASGYDQQRLLLELTAYDDGIAAAAIELRASQRRLATLLDRSGALVDASGDLQPGAPPALDAIAAEALARRGDYRAAKARIAAANEERSAAGRTWVPTLELTVGGMSQDAGTDRAFGYVAGLALNLPIFDRGSAAAARAEAARRAATADARWLERYVPDAIRTAHETWVARIEQARSFQATQLARLAQLLASAEAAYRDGGGTIVELLDAYRSAREARLHELELRRDASLAELDLWLALGGRP